MLFIESTELVRRTSWRTKRARASRPSGEWKNEDYDVLADGGVVGRIYEDGSISSPPSCGGSGP